MEPKQVVVPSVAPLPSLPPFEQAKILCAMPHMDTFIPENTLDFLGLTRPLTSMAHFVGMTYLHDARNAAVEAMYDNGLDYVFFIDSDMTFPADGLQKLYEADYDICAAVYHMRRSPYSPVAYWRNDVVPDWRGLPTCRSIEWDSQGEGVLDVDVVGTGFTLIKRWVFDLFWDTEWADGIGCGSNSHYSHTWASCQCKTCAHVFDCNYHAQTHFEGEKVWEKNAVQGCPRYKVRNIKPFQLDWGYGEDTGLCMDLRKRIPSIKIGVHRGLVAGHLTRAKIIGKQIIELADGSVVPQPLMEVLY